MTEDNLKEDNLKEDNLNKDKLNYESRFDDKSREVIVLTKFGVAAASLTNKNWEAVEYTIAYVEAETGEHVTQEKRLVWFMTNEECNSVEKVFSLESQHIYRLKVRNSLSHSNVFGNIMPYGEEFLVEEVLERDCKEPWLEQMLEAYNKPVVLQTKYTEELLLNRNFYDFEGEAEWNGERCTVTLEGNKGTESVGDPVLQTLQDLFENSGEWDKKARAYAADKLLSLANDWYYDDIDIDDTMEADNEELPISREMFINRLTISSIVICRNGAFDLYYDNDEMFTDHAVTVSGDWKGGFKEANIQ